MEQRSPELRVFGDEIVVDMFAGGGGTSEGIEMALGRPPDVAANHNKRALAMHRANHPDTLHLCEDVRDVNPYDLYKRFGRRRFGLLWLSPDCTFFSKAKGGKPFRDPRKARRVRGLIGVALRWAALPMHMRPRVICVENVEEIQDWCPLGPDGRPDPAKRGQSFQRWRRRMVASGYTVEIRELVACDYGAPTKRKRLFIICRCDERPIVWPVPTHGKGRQPYRTAAECIDFSLPVPSIFLSPADAKAWGEAHGVPSPRRPLAEATLRRVARGVWRYVIESAEPFIVPCEGGAATPFLSRFNSERRDGDQPRGQQLGLPLNTLDTSNRYALVTPILALNSEQRGDRVYSANEPMRTLTAAGCRTWALVAPTLINTRNGERHGRHGEQAPRVYDIRQPWGTITATGSQGAMVAAFLAKHNGGHEATGQRLLAPVDTVTCRDQKALVTSHLMKLYGTCRDGQPVGAPMPTVTAAGNHIAEVRAFLLKFYGTKRDGCSMRLPLDTITTKDRFGLVVTIHGEDYVIVDIGMRMLTPPELYLAQGFPPDYEIEQGIDIDTGARVRFTKAEQTLFVGNSVSPYHAAAIVGANYHVA